MNLADISSKQPQSVFEFMLEEVKAFSENLIQRAKNKCEGSDITDEGSIRKTPRVEINCICKLEGLGTMEIFSCKHCGKFSHFTCYGILNAFSKDNYSRFDPEARFSCVDCPSEVYSDLPLKMMSENKRSNRAITRIPIRYFVDERRENILIPIKNRQEDLLKEDWKKFIPKYFIKIVDQLGSNPCRIYHDGLPDQDISSSFSENFDHEGRIEQESECFLENQQS